MKKVWQQTVYAFQMRPCHPPFISNWTVSKKSQKGTTKSERPSKDWTSLHGQGCACGVDRGLLDRDVLAERLRINLEEKNRQFTKLYEAEALSFDDIFERIMNIVNKSNNKQCCVTWTILWITASACSLKAQGLCWISMELIHLVLVKPSCCGWPSDPECRPK